MSATELDTSTGLAWVSDLAFEGMSTGDGRYIAQGALAWRDLPLTLMAMVETTEGGHLGAQVAGRIDTIDRTRADMSGDRLPDGVTAFRGTGVFDTGEYGSEIARMVGDEVLRGVSIDMSINEWALRDPVSGDIISLDDATDDQWEAAFLGDMEMAITDGEIMAATVCPTPAFADARIALTAGSRMGFGNVWRDSEDRLMTTVWAPIHLAHPDPDPLVAASQIPVKPPRDWFFQAETDHATPLTFTEDGRVFGHIAAWDSCHTGFINGDWSQCVTPPTTRTDYAHFHVGEMPTAEGDLVPVGKLMLGEAHAPGAHGRVQARAFYDRTGTVGAYVRAVDGKHGIWVSGVLRNDLTDEQRRDLHCNPPSGDWRAVDRNLELIAVLAVPVPGFPIPRSQMSLAASADGDMYVSALILSGGVEDHPVLVGQSLQAAALAAEIDGGGDALDALIQGE